jgi:hypothetical protein
VPVVYERSLESSIHAAAEAFNQQQHGKCNVTLTPMASRQGMKAILYQNTQAALWNPADELWLAKLVKAWKDPKVGKDVSLDVVKETETLFTTRLVLVAWPDRAGVLRHAMAEPKYRGKTWHLLHDLAHDGWPAAGGPAEWGKLKLVTSHPLESNSAASSLLLQYLELAQSQPSLDPYDASLTDFMRTLYGSVVELTETTGKAFDAFVGRGAGRADVAICYEANAAKAAHGGRTDFQVIYPQPTIEARFPGAVVTANGVTPEMAAGAHEFLQFLRGAEAQAHAIDDGLRSVRPEQEALVEKALLSPPLDQMGFQANPDLIERAPGASTVDSLVDDWNSKVARPDDRRD